MSARLAPRRFLPLRGACRVHRSRRLCRDRRRASRKAGLMKSMPAARGPSDRRSRARTGASAEPGLRLGPGGGGRQRRGWNRPGRAGSLYRRRRHCGRGPGRSVWRRVGALRLSAELHIRRPVRRAALFRAIAGIWPCGEDRISTPAGALIMVVTPKPYIPIGTLRSAVTYPAVAGTYKDNNIRTALADAHLPHLVGRTRPRGGLVAAPLERASSSAWRS